MIAVSPPARRRQWIELAAAAFAIVLVGALLVAVFRGSSSTPEMSPGGMSSPMNSSPTSATTPTATVTVTASAPTTPQQGAELPTPDDTGTYRDLSVEQAQELVHFPLVMPDPVPNGLEGPDIMVEESPPIATGGRIYRVVSFFGLEGDEDPQQAVEYLQTNRAPVNPPAEDATTLAVNRQMVQKAIIERPDASPVAVYWWESPSGTYRQLMALIEGEMTVPLVEQLMAAIVIASEQQPGAQTQRLEQEREALRPYPVPETCEVTEWSGPDFRIRRDDSAAYFIDGNGLSLGTTHGLLFARENQITWLADGPLTTEQALSGPQGFSATRLDDTTEYGDISIQSLTQIDQGIIADDTVERAWTSIVTLHDAGCWRVQAEIGEHSIDTIVYVYPNPEGGASLVPASHRHTSREPASLTT